MSAIEPSTPPRSEFVIESDWRERASRLYADLRAPAAAMVQQAYPGLLSGEEIEDAYSNAWLGTLRALAGRHRGLSDSDVRNYLYAAMANSAAKEARRRSRRPAEPLDDSVFEFIGDRHGATPQDRVDAAEEVAVVRDLVTSLPPRRRSVMLLRYGWGLNPKQICERIDGLSPRAYRREIARGVEQLARRMSSFENGDWCKERASTLRDFAAGLTDKDKSLQVKNHLIHCRFCAAHVAEIRRSLRGLRVALPAPLGVEVLLGEQFATSTGLQSAWGWVKGLADDAVGLVTGLPARLRGVEAVPAATSDTAAPAVGAGVASTGGIIASFGAGKVIAGCVAGVSACAVIGVGGAVFVSSHDPAPQQVDPVPIEEAVEVPAVVDPAQPAASAGGASAAAERETEVVEAEGSDEQRVASPEDEFDAVDRAARPTAPVPQAPSPDQVNSELGLP